MEEDLRLFQSKVYHSQGLVYENQEMTKEALSCYKKALIMKNNHIPTKYHIALMYHDSNDYQNALKNFTDVLKEIGGDRLVYERRGRVFQDMKEHQKAILDFNNAIKIESNYPMVYYYRGMSKIEDNQLHEAIEDFNM